MQDTFQTVMGLVGEAQRIVIVPSDPDADSIGTSLALQKWLANQNILSDIYCYYDLDGITASDYPVEQFTQIKKYQTYVPQATDLVVLLDGGSWQQFFEEDYDQLVEQLLNSQAKLVFFDHHDNHQLPQDKFSVAVNQPEVGATAQVVFQSLLKGNLAACDQTVLDLIIYSLFGDTGRLAWHTNAGTYHFVGELKALGANDRKAANYSTNWKDFEFFAFALPLVQKFPEAKLLICAFNLADYNSITSEKGADFWHYADFFKNQLGKTAAGFDHLVMLRELEPGVVKINWRSRDYGVTAKLLNVFQTIGAQVGGHDSAGGGQWLGSISDLQSQLVAKLTQP